MHLLLNSYAVITEAQLTVCPPCQLFGVKDVWTSYQIEDSSSSKVYLQQNESLIVVNLMLLGSSELSQLSSRHAQISCIFSLDRFLLNKSFPQPG